MRQRVNDGPDSPDVVLLRHSRDLGPDPLVSPGPVADLFAQGREAEISEHDSGEGVSGRDSAPEEHVCGLDVAVHDSPPISRRCVRIGCEAVVAVVKERNGVGELDEAMPQEVLGYTTLAPFRDKTRQIAALAVFKVQDQGTIVTVVVSMIELDDAGVAGQYALEDVHLARNGALHVKAFLLFAHQNLPVAFPLDEPELALAAFADVPELFVRISDEEGAVCLRGSMDSALPYRHG